MTVAEALSDASERLAQAGVAEPRREAASLLAFVLKRAAVFLIAHPEHELSEDETAEFISAVERRTIREPFQYITGRQQFYGLDFVVCPGVLIPRPETEILVAAAIEALPDGSRFCEIGVGSGCISVSILKKVPEATAVTVDISDDALVVAAENAKEHGVADRIEIFRSDLFEAVTGTFDLMVSNPPYVPETDRAKMQVEVREFEPARALFAGPDGLDVIRRIIFEAPTYLNHDGLLLMEIGFGQADGVAGLFDPTLWSDVAFLNDLQLIPRVVRARRR